MLFFFVEKKTYKVEKMCPCVLDSVSFNDLVVLLKLLVYNFY